MRLEVEIEPNAPAPEFGKKNACLKPHAATDLLP